MHQRRALLLAFAVPIALALSGCAYGCSLGSIPSRPMFSNVYDGADVLGSLTELQVGSATRTAHDRLGAEAVVVTVRRTRDFGASSIDQLATRWFEAWRIGGGVTSNPARGKGVLLIVAVDDRDARIELGRGFSASASSNARRIMNDVIVPRMRKGDIDGGIAAGAEALADLEAARFGADTGFFNTNTRGVRAYSAFGFGGFVGGGLFGIVLIVLGVMFKRSWLAGLGIGVFALTLFTKVVFVGLIILLLLFAPRSRRSSRRKSRRVWSSGRGATGRW